MKNNKLSINFKNFSTRDVLQLLAKIANKNMVVTGSVKGKISLSLNNLSWQQVLKIILESNGLGMRRVEDSFIIAPISEIISKEKMELVEHQKLEALEPLQSKLLKINYANANEIVKLLRDTKGKPLLSKRGSVNADNRTNTIWIQDTRDKLQHIVSFIKKLDVPTKQVLIKARIISVDSSSLYEIGVRFGLFRADSSLNQPLEKPAGFSSSFRNLKDFTHRLTVNLPAVTPAAGTIGIALSKLGEGILLDLELSALQNEGDIRIIASPRLLTANREQAVIETGEEIPYQQATLSGATAVEFKKAVLRLKVTPQITPNNRIILKLSVNQDKRGANILAGIPTIDTREIMTQVLVNNGQTIVLGGIFTKNHNNQVDRIPFLSNIPILGHLFKHKKYQDRLQELLIFVTPKIV